MGNNCRGGPPWPPVAAPTAKNKNALDLRLEDRGRLNSMVVPDLLWRHLPFPGAAVVASVAAGKVSWLPAHRFTAFPISRGDQWRDGSDAIAGTQWREPSGLFTQLPLSPSMGTCDGPTRRRRVETAIAKLQRTGFSYWRGVTLCL